jgi:hypothetical protein
MLELCSWEKCGACFRSWYGLNLPQAHGTDDSFAEHVHVHRLIGTAHSILAPSATGTAGPYRKLCKLIT